LFDIPIYAAKIKNLSDKTCQREKFFYRLLKKAHIMQAIALQDMVSQPSECSTICGNWTALLKTSK